MERVALTSLAGQTGVSLNYRRETWENHGHSQRASQRNQHHWASPHLSYWMLRCLLTTIHGYTLKGCGPSNPRKTSMTIIISVTPWINYNRILLAQAWNCGGVWRQTLSKKSSTSSFFTRKVFAGRCIGWLGFLWLWRGGFVHRKMSQWHCGVCWHSWRGTAPWRLVTDLVVGKKRRPCTRLCRVCRQPAQLKHILKLL